MGFLLILIMFGNGLDLVEKVMLKILLITNFKEKDDYKMDKEVFMILVATP
jgi:hypothetical protein